MAGLSDSQCRAAKPKEKPYKLYDRDGLYLYVKKNGTKTWRKKFYFHQKEQIYTIGDYPIVSLAEARDQASIAKSLVKSGINPNEEKRENIRKLAAEHEHKFETIALDWYNTRKSEWSHGHARVVLGRLNRDVLPRLGRRAIQKITKADVLEVLRKMEAREVYESAKRARQYIHSIFEHAIVADIVTANPANRIEEMLVKAKPGNYPSVHYKELPELLKAINDRQEQHHPTYSNAIKLLMLTGLRTGELRKAKWDEIDFKNAVWSIPAERMKKRRPHQVPLSSHAIAILEGQQRISGEESYIFPQERNTDKPMSENAILNILYKAGYKGRMTGHGFRALATTALIEQLRIPQQHVFFQLAHLEKDRTKAAYNRAEYWDDRVKMMQEWADFCEKAGDISPVTFPREGDE